MVRVAVIGAGRWGSNIIRTLEQLPDVQLVAVCSKNETELAALPSTYQKISDSKKLLSLDLDAVCVATPGSTHAAIALPFIERGMATFIEKPFTTSLADAEVLEKAAKKSRALVFVGHVHLYNPAYLQAKELVKSAGKLRLLYFEGTNNGPYRDDMSAMWDWAPHDIYLTLDVVKKMPTHVQAWGIAQLRPKTTLYDFVTIKLTFPGGLTAVSLTSWLLPRKQKRMTVVGSKDSVVFDDAAEQKILLYKGMGPTVAGKRVHKQEPEVSYPSYAAAASLTQELQAFVKAVTTRKKPVSGLEQGVAVTKILAAAEKSIALEGKKIKL